LILGLADRLLDRFYSNTFYGHGVKYRVSQFDTMQRNAVLLFS